MKNPVSFFSSACLLAFLLCFSSCAVHSQVTSRVEEISGVAYYMHTVEKRQTLYSISKLYKCDINDIAESNPGAEAGLQEGQVLRIPVAKSKVKGNSLEVHGNRSYLVHEVKKKETIFGIARQYEIDPNDLIAANPGADHGIKKGQQLRIPVKIKPAEIPQPAAVQKHLVQPGETLYSIAKKYSLRIEDIQNANAGLKEGLKAGAEILIPTNIGPDVTGIGTLPDKRFGEQVLVVEPVYKEKYHIALMLPFYTHYADTMESRDKKLREVAVNIYRGALLAADSLQKKGLTAEIHVYDVLDEKGKVGKILEKPEMKDMDLIIGPTFKGPLTEVCQWASDKGIHVVCPVQQPNNVLLSSPNMSKAVPSAATMWVSMARYLYKKHPNENIILIDSKNIDDRRLVDAFREEWKKLSGDSLRNVIVVADASSFSVKEKYAAGKQNIVVVPTNDKKVISTLFKVLGEGNITVYGTDAWDNMEGISVANRNRYHVHFPQLTYLDYNDLQVQKWIEAYRKKFRSEPANYSISGYDLVMYYGMGLKTFGRAFPNHFDEIAATTFGSGYDYFKTSDEGGFENQFVMVIGTDNYQLIREQ